MYRSSAGRASFVQEASVLLPTMLTLGPSLAKPDSSHQVDTTALGRSLRTAYTYCGLIGKTLVSNLQPGEAESFVHCDRCAHWN